MNSSLRFVRALSIQHGCRLKSFLHIKFYYLVKINILCQKNYFSVPYLVVMYVMKVEPDANKRKDQLALFSEGDVNEHDV